jgi:hypothetical protein
MGGLADAVFWMGGPNLSDALLNGFTPNISELWFGWVKHIHSALKEYLLKRCKCPDILKMEDSSPVVIQLRSGNKSETHAICIYKGWIYDLASQFVIKKTEEALNWCCGTFGFKAHMRLYCLELQEGKVECHTKKKKAKRICLG